MHYQTKKTFKTKISKMKKKLLTILSLTVVSMVAMADGWTRPTKPVLNTTGEATLENGRCYVIWNVSRKKFVTGINDWEKRIVLKESTEDIFPEIMIVKLVNFDGTTGEGQLQLCGTYTFKGNDGYQVFTDTYFGTTDYMPHQEEDNNGELVFDGNGDPKMVYDACYFNGTEENITIWTIVKVAGTENNFYIKTPKGQFVTVDWGNNNLMLNVPSGDNQWRFIEASDYLIYRAQKSLYDMYDKLAKEDEEISGAISTAYGIYSQTRANYADEYAFTVALNDAREVLRQSISYIISDNNVTKVDWRYYTTMENATIETDGQNIGKTNGDTKVTFTIKNEAVGGYVMNFFSGADNNVNAKIKVKVTPKNGGDAVFEVTSDVEKSGNWCMAIPHAYLLKDLPTGYYTVTIEADVTSGTYAGNFGNLSFTKLPNSPSDVIPTSDFATLAHFDYDGHDDNGNRYFHEITGGEENETVGNINNNNNTATIWLNSQATDYNFYIDFKRKEVDGKLFVSIIDVNGNASGACTKVSGEVTFGSTVDYQTSKVKMKGVGTGTKLMTMAFAPATSWQQMGNYKNVELRELVTLSDEVESNTVETKTRVDVDLIRTIEANTWSTLVLPFPVTEVQVNTLFGEDRKLKSMSDRTNGTTVELDNATVMNANEPYLIRVSKEFTGYSFENKEFVNTTAPDNDGPKKTVGGITFHGTYNQIDIPKPAYFLNSNKLWKTTDSNTDRLKPTRGYFSTTTSGARLVLNLDDEDVTNVVSVPTAAQLNRQEVYNLIGQRTTAQRREMYILRSTQGGPNKKIFIRK